MTAPLDTTAPSRHPQPAPDAIGVSGGARVGLFVCRQLVEAMGGRVWAQAGPGFGAGFGYWLPSAPDYQVEEPEGVVTASG